MYVALLPLLLLLTLLLPSPVQSTTVDRRSCHSVLYNEGCSYSELTVKRVAYSATVPRQITVYLHAQSSETLLLQVLVLFVDLRPTLHGALLFNPSRAYKYLKVMRESDFQYNNELWLTSRGRRVMLQYELDENATYLDPLGPYDAALLLGAHSTLWHQYNTLITERTQLILRYDDVTTVDNTRQDFAGVYALQCGQDGGHACQVTGSGAAGLWVNGRFYAGHRLIVDPTAASNRLPVELYMRWQYHGERVLSVAATEDGPLVMHLNRRFQYEAHSNDSVRDIVVGPDVWHFFQRTERRMETAQLLLYYTRYYNAVDGDDQPFRQFGVCVFVTVLLIGLFQWFTSTDYDILYLMLRQRRGDDARVAFEYKQVMAEVNAVVCCALLWLLTLIFTDPLSAPNFIYSHTSFQQRKLLLYIFAAPHFLVALLVLALSRHTTVRAYRHYTKWCELHLVSSPQHKDYAYVKRWAAKLSGKLDVDEVVIRELTTHTLLALDLLFIFNYMSQEKLIASYYYVAVALTLFFFYIKYLFVASLRLYQTRRKWRAHITLLVYVVLSTLWFALYAGFSVPLTFLAFFVDVNSTYSQTTLSLATVLFLTIVALGALLVVHFVVRDYAERRLAQHRRRLS